VVTWCHHIQNRTLRGSGFCYRNRNRKKRKPTMTQTEIANRLNLRLVLKTRHEQRYASIDTSGSPRISLRSTSYYCHFSWSCWHLSQNDDGIWESLLALWKQHKPRHKRLQAWGDDHYGGWYRCDSQAAEAIVGLLEQNYIIDNVQA